VDVVVVGLLTDVDRAGLGQGWLAGEVEAEKVVLEPSPFMWYVHSSSLNVVLTQELTCGGWFCRFAPVRELHGDAKARRDAAEEAEFLKVAPENLLARVGARG
jgi:hypothetical protein